MESVLKQAHISPDQIQCLIIGTTAFINAVVEQDTRRLKPVAVLRLSKSFLQEIPPFSGWPPGLAQVCDGYLGYIDGGLAIDGSEEAPVNLSQARDHCKKIKALGISSVVIAGIFSPIDQTFKQEDRVRDVVLDELPDADVVCSHEVANIGFKERENASILNASIIRFARHTVTAFRLAMEQLGLTCPLYLTQNDGTVVDSETAARVPIRTFSSGATNSMRGAAYLCGRESTATEPIIVVDIGGTTTDVGILEKSGFPRQSPAYVSVAGIEVNYNMPLLYSIGLGGGSIVRKQVGRVTVGPDSVGQNLLSASLAFGGDTMTATDISVAAGRATLGTTEVVSKVPRDTVSQSERQVRVLLEGAVDKVKTSPEPMMVLLVGGGSIIAPSDLKGASRIFKPFHHDVANAVGAATSKVGGTVDIVQSTARQTQAQATAYAKTLAIHRAEAAGAIASSIQVVEVDTIPLQYVANQVRTIVKAVGELDAHPIERKGKPEIRWTHSSERLLDKQEDRKYHPQQGILTLPDPLHYRPSIVRDDSGALVWEISTTDLQYLSWGMYVLGCGGGGNPESTRGLLQRLLQEGHVIRVVDASALSLDAVVYCGGHMGSPAVSVERLAATETVDAIRVLMDYLHHDSFDAVISLEIGGANGLEPFLLGCSKYFNRPVVDGDWMGRAYPTYWQTTLAAYQPGHLVPCAIDSGDGNSIIMTRASCDEIVDRALRGSCAEMGSRVGMAARPMTGEQVQRYGIINSCSLAWRIGRCIATAQATNSISTVAEAIVTEAGGHEAATILFRGKIMAVERRLYKGHSYGEIVVRSMPPQEVELGYQSAAERGDELRIPFKNENILAEYTDRQGHTRVMASVPDLIAVIDTGTGRALGVPEYRYGVQVTVLGISCSRRWIDAPLGLRIGGPAAFGFDIEYHPIGTHRQPRSVLDEFAPD